MGSICHRQDVYVSQDSIPETLSDLWQLCVRRSGNKLSSCPDISRKKLCFSLVINYPKSRSLSWAFTADISRIYDRINPASSIFLDISCMDRVYICENRPNREPVRNNHMTDCGWSKKGGQPRWNIVSNIARRVSSRWSICTTRAIYFCDDFRSHNFWLQTSLPRSPPTLTQSYITPNDLIRESENISNDLTRLLCSKWRWAHKNSRTLTPVIRLSEIIRSQLSLLNSNISKRIMISFATYISSRLLSIRAGMCMTHKCEKWNRKRHGMQKRRDFQYTEYQKLQ